MKTILFISIDPVFYSRRVINQIESAIQAGLAVHILTVKPEISRLSKAKIYYINKPFSRGPLRFLHFYFYILRCLFATKYDVVHARGIWILPAIIISKIFKKYKLIYEAHEFFAGHELFQNHLWRRLTWLPVERLAVPLMDVLITVSDPLGTLYKERYPKLKNVKIIRSLPHQLKTNPELKVNETLQIVFHGYFLPGRALTQLLDAINLIRNESFELTIIGDGPLKKMIKDKIIQLNLPGKINLKPLISNERLLENIQFADLGISLIEPDCINRTYALPNKFFEYIHAGLAVLASNIPTLQEYVQKYKIGYCVDPYSVQDIAQVIMHVINNKNELIEMKKNCRFAAQELSWQNESEKLKAIYNELIK